MLVPDANDAVFLMTNSERSQVLTPIARRLLGFALTFRGATLLRRASGSQVESVTITRFDDLDAVRAFAGDDYEVAVIVPDARPLLTHYNARSAHYETAFSID